MIAIAFESHAGKPGDDDGRSGIDAIHNVVLIYTENRSSDDREISAASVMRQQRAAWRSLFACRQRSHGHG